MPESTTVSERLRNPYRRAGLLIAGMIGLPLLVAFPLTGHGDRAGFAGRPIGIGILVSNNPAVRRWDDEHPPAA